MNLSTNISWELYVKVSSAVRGIQQHKTVVNRPYIGWNIKTVVNLARRNLDKEKLRHLFLFSLYTSKQGPLYRCVYSDTRCQVHSVKTEVTYCVSIYNANKWVLLKQRAESTFSGHSAMQFSGICHLSSAQLHSTVFWIF